MNLPAESRAASSAIPLRADAASSGACASKRELLSGLGPAGGVRPRPASPCPAAPRAAPEGLPSAFTVCGPGPCSSERGGGRLVAPSDPSPQQKDPGRTRGGRPFPPPRGSRPPRVCGQMQDTPTGPARGGLLRVRASRGCRNKLPPNQGLQTTHTSVLSRFCGPEVQTRLLGLKIEVLPTGSGRASFSCRF